MGRIDIATIEMIVGYSLLNKIYRPAQAQMITNHPKPIAESHYYLMISKTLPLTKQKKILKDFNNGLKVLKDSGKYRKMVEDMIQGYYNAD